MIHPVPGGPTNPEKKRGGRKKVPLFVIREEQMILMHVCKCKCNENSLFYFILSIIILFEEMLFFFLDRMKFIFIIYPRRHPSA
jgi:hypothetical protein